MFKGKIETSKELKKLTDIVLYNLDLVEETCRFELEFGNRFSRSEYESYISLLNAYHNCSKIVLSKWETNSDFEFSEFFSMLPRFLEYIELYFKNKNGDNLRRLQVFLDNMKDIVKNKY